jgi:pentatricopeptide repeat protein
MAPPRAVDPAVDLQAGDLDGAGLAAGESAGGSTGPWAGAPAGTVGEDDAGDRDDALHTNTLAELYLRQGLVDRAVEVYRSMLRVDPDNQKAARRFADLTRTTGPPGAAPDPGIAARTAKPPTVAATKLERPAPVASPPAGPEARRPDARIHRLERGLERMRSGSAREANTR